MLSIKLMRYALDSSYSYILCLGFRPRACLIIALSGTGSTHSLSKQLIKGKDW